MSAKTITDESGIIEDWYLDQLEDEAIDGVDICPDDVVLLINRLRAKEKLAASKEER